MGWSDASTWGIIFVGALLLLVLRLAVNYLPGKTPPVFEGIPFIGGILKFSKVRCFNRGEDVHNNLKRSERIALKLSSDPFKHFGFWA
jgi:hypothetical protein